MLQLLSGARGEENNPTHPPELMSHYQWELSGRGQGCCRLTGRPEPESEDRSLERTSRRSHERTNLSHTSMMEETRHGQEMKL